MAALASQGSVTVIRGPTPILDGDAQSAEDLTIMNERLAATFALGTLPPWGVTKGHIIDLAPVSGGSPLGDLIAQFSFVLDGWGNWAEYTSFDVVEESSERVVVRAVGYWEDIEVEVTYTLEEGKNYIKVEIVLTNKGSQAYQDLVSGYAISLKRGWTFTPGFGTANNFRPTPNEELGVLDTWVAGYDEDFVIGIYAPYFTHLSTSTSWVDPFTVHTLEPGESRVFEAYLIVDATGNLCSIPRTIMELRGEKPGFVEGLVTSGGRPVENPVIMVFREGRPYCWTVGDVNGSYTLELPPGNYTIKAAAKGYGVSSPMDVEVEAGATIAIDFDDMPQPGIIELTVVEISPDGSEAGPVDARVRIEGGEAPLVKYLETRIVYTSPDDIGRALITLPEGIYTLIVERGGGFTSEPVVVEGVEVVGGQTAELAVYVEQLVDPREYGWYSADLHHHADYLEARTSPGLLVVAQSAARLDYVFVSDHDYTGNYSAIAEYASSRGMPFLPSVEVSPGWAHFNPYPLPLDLDYKPIRGTACEMLQAMRELGAIVIRANHPATGYFSAWESGEIPGGYCDDWDVAEINGAWGRSDEYTLAKMWELWNRGVRKYLTAGSDVHDVIATPFSGSPRVYAYIQGAPTPEAFAYAEKQGRSYITYGPLILEADPMFGETVVTSDGIVKVRLELFAVHGLASLEVISEGEVVLTEQLTAGESSKVELELNLSEMLVDSETWIQFRVFDADEHLALTNPIWVVVGETQETTVTETVTVTESKTETVRETVTKTLEATVTETQTESVVEIETVTEPVGSPSMGVAVAGVVLGLIIGFATAYFVLGRR